MKAASMTSRPEFDLMKQTDLLLFYHIQIPRWLFYDRRFKHISLEAKMAYGFLLGRFQLSKLNNWINDNGEVFLVYTRGELGEELGISYRKTISCMKELRDCNLVWERRCGRGDANQIYLAHVEHNEEDARTHRSAPFVSPGDEAAGNLRSADIAPLEDCENLDEISGCDDVLIQEGPDSQVKKGDNSTSRAPETAGQEVPKPHPNYIYKNNNYQSDTESSQSVGHSREVPDGLTDDIAGLEDVLRGCELWTFAPITAKVFENAIERLWFSKSFNIGKAVLPQKKVRSHLRELDNIRLQEAERKIFSNTERIIKNSTAYVMAVIFNTIWEVESDIMADPYLNCLRRGLEGGGP